MIFLNGEWRRNEWLGGGFKHFLFSPLFWGDDPIWLAHLFFRWLVQPPTRRWFCFFLGDGPSTHAHGWCQKLAEAKNGTGTIPLPPFPLPPPSAAYRRKFVPLLAMKGGGVGCVWCGCFGSDVEGKNSNIYMKLCRWLRRVCLNLLHILNVIFS